MPSAPRPAEASRRSTRQRDRRRDVLLSMVVPLLVTIVALTQMGLAHTRDLTPWRGAGFGMFSTVDSHSSRFVRVALDIGEATPVPVDVASIPGDTELASLLVDYAALPDRRRSLRVYEAISGVSFTATGDIATYAGPADRTRLLVGAGSSSHIVQRVELAAWTTDFDGRSGRLSARRLDATSGRP